MDLSAGTLLASLFVSTIGFGLFRYGKSEMRTPQLLVGLVMMIYPYFIANVVWSFGLAGALLAAVWLATRAGL
jgi:hypothetical protein